MKSHIVLGLGFGDEGKGSMTNYLASKLEKPIVVRFSGGQQAGHTVVKDDTRHIFSSFGSGTLLDVPSYFSEHTTIYLSNILTERNVLREKGINPKLFIHPLAIMTTPYDVAYNRLSDGSKGSSCGLGIGTTMIRHTTSGYKLFAIDVINKKILKQKLEGIKKYYEKLCAHNGIRHFQDEYEKYERLFYESIDQELFQIKEYDFLLLYENLIFEGSQGIMLDMDHGIFPDVTFANTTSKNALEINKKLEIDIEDIETYYVTRTYQTRHGRGWLSNDDKIEIINNEKETNVLNEYQGDFKVCELDYDLLNYSIEIDRIYNKSRSNLVITCLDQRPSFKFDYLQIKMKEYNIYNSSSDSEIKFMGRINPITMDFDKIYSIYAEIFGLK